LVNNPSDGGPGFLSSRDGGALSALNLATGPHDVSDDLPPTPGMFSFDKMADTNTQHTSQQLVSDEQKSRAKERALQMSKELDDILMMLKQRKQMEDGGLPSADLTNENKKSLLRDMGITGMGGLSGMGDDEDGGLEGDEDLSEDFSNLLLGKTYFKKMGSTEEKKEKKNFQKNN